MHPLEPLKTYLHPLIPFGAIMLIGGGLLVAGSAAGYIGSTAGVNFNGGLWGYYAVLGSVLAVLGIGLWLVARRDVAVRAPSSENV
ncbi:hypothetical protein [Halovenus salina]|uniref:Uncharacterized protein n=2 Tax=Halovenus salina TaxID=1510225 RepID=A0ABD5W5F4_9EURY